MAPVYSALLVAVWFSVTSAEPTSFAPTTSSPTQYPSWRSPAPTNSTYYPTKTRTPTAVSFTRYPTPSLSPSRFPT